MQPDRRRFLRASGVALALPWLDSLTPARAAAPSPAPSAPRRVAEPASHAPSIPVVPAVLRQEAPGSATVLTLGAHMCKWPIGDPASDSFTFCGKNAGEGGPYCDTHAQIAYQPQQARKKNGVNDLARSLRRLDAEHGLSQGPAVTGDVALGLRIGKDGRPCSARCR